MKLKEEHRQLIAFVTGNIPMEFQDEPLPKFTDLDLKRALRDIPTEVWRRIFAGPYAEKANTTMREALARLEAAKAARS